MRRFVGTGVLALSASIAFGDVIELKDEASIKGRIIAEKAEHVAVDVGYTILMVPRDAIAKVVTPKDEEAKEDAKKGENTTPPVSAQIAGSLYSNPGALRKEGTVRELVAILGEAVVQVRTPGGLGSGFFINEEGYLITNFHVIENETQISIEVYHNKNGQLDRRTYKQVRIVAMNKFADLALLKVDDKDAPKFAWVLMGDSDALSVGDRVFAIGSPLGLERTVTEGILSTKTRALAGELYMQTTTQINPGNSGGPLFNLKGEVVGVTNMKIQFGEGLGFAIPGDAVKFFLNHRDAYAYDNDNPSNPFRYLEPPRKTLFGGKSTDQPTVTPK
ncbi:MAG TPA: trypsin-like peptidase domain-containing protein [Verrucomicrobiae bacterium]